MPVEILGVLAVPGVQETPPVGASPDPPTTTGSLTGVYSLTIGYDVFDANGVLIYRTKIRPMSWNGREWAARRETFDADRLEAVEVTSGEERPALLHVLEQVAVLDVGRFDVLGISGRSPQIPPGTLDGYTYRFFGGGLGPDETHTSISAEGSNGPVGAPGR